jgi:hypothetical protein
MDMELYYTIGTTRSSRNQQFGPAIGGLRPTTTRLCTQVEDFARESEGVT